MSLTQLLQFSNNREHKVSGFLTEERIRANLPIYRQWIAFWREYPDLFVDFLCGGQNAPPETLHLFFYQRVFLRAVMRHRYVYATFPRAYSKSFLSVLALMLRCVLYPGAHLFVTSGGKEQAAGIAREKVGQLCKLIPGLNNEINWERGVTKASKDMVEYIFKNGSQLDIMAARESSRGKRKTGGLVEEVILVDSEMLNSVIIPRFWGLIMRIISEKRRELKKKRCEFFINLLTVNSQKHRAKLYYREGVETMSDECSSVGWILSPFEVRRNYLKFFGHTYII